MSVIYTLKKDGQIMETQVQDTVGEIWTKMNGNYEVNIEYNSFNRDFMLLTDLKGQGIIFNKRYLWKIDS